MPSDADNFVPDVYRYIKKFDTYIGATGAYAEKIKFNSDGLPDSLTTPENKNCKYSVPGCLNPLATNFDETATIGDGSCLFDFGDNSGAGST